MTPRDLATRAALVKAMIDVLRDVDAATKTALMDVLDPGDRKHASVDGRDCGTVSVSKGRESWKVTDDAAFTRWVKTHRPDAIVESVRKSDQASILAGIKGDGEVPDGVEPSFGDPYVSVRLTDDQRSELIAAFRSGAARLPELDAAVTAAGGSS